MPLSVTQLKKKWYQEKAAYARKEVGTGVQKFVKDMLKSPDIFALREGLESTKQLKRKNEFTEETRKLGHQADVVIFINKDIVIPVEVERYQNIDAGIDQIFQYQTDWDKKYGILTDGYRWRFYNNNLYREFTLKHLFDNTSLFWEFWKEYIKPENYYLSIFEGPRGQQFLFKDLEKLHVEKYRDIFFEDIKMLIESFSKKLEIEGYLSGIDKKQKRGKAIEITYAYVIQFILYKTLVDNGFGDFPREYEQNLKEIHKHLKQKTYKYIIGRIDEISNRISRNIYRPFTDEQEIISSKFNDLYRKTVNTLSDISPWLDIFVVVNKYSFDNVRNEIFGYVYENYLKELNVEKSMGQYFTDPAIVNFMLQQVGYTSEKIETKILQNQSDKLSIIDPSCGSGTFLYKAADEIIKAFRTHTVETSKQIETLITNNVFGLDVAEFPLYLAEMNIIMRMLPFIVGEDYNNPLDKKIKMFWTKDSIAEFIGSGLENTDVDHHLRGNQSLIGFPEQEFKYDSFMRDLDDLIEVKKSVRKQERIPRRRFDYVIGNPPYISYPQCRKQGILVFDLMPDTVRLKNIYGVNLWSPPDRPKKYSPKPNFFAFFIALGLALLKDDARLCYIVPQNLLTAHDLDGLRYHLAKFITLEKIINFPQNLFIQRGLKQRKVIPTSSLVFVARKKIPTATQKVDIINYLGKEDTIEETVSNILNGKKIARRSILQAEFLRNVINWNFIKHERVFSEFYAEYKKNTENIDVYYEHRRARNKFGNMFFLDGGAIIDRKLLVSRKKDAYEVFDYKNNDYSKLRISRSQRYYPKKNSISFPQGSQGIVTFQQQYKIIWRTRHTPCFQFCDWEVLLNRNQSLIMSSNNREEIIYLLALLNSRVTRIILEKNLRQEMEKNFFIAITGIKDYVRVPLIQQSNQHIKEEIIRATKEALEIEVKTLSDFVDFSTILRQKFDTVEVKGRVLILKYINEIIKLGIRGDTRLITEVIAQSFFDNELRLKAGKITLASLKKLPIVDTTRLYELKGYLDDLIFALCFDVQIGKVAFSDAKNLKQLCDKKKFYAVIRSNSKQI